MSAEPQDKVGAKLPLPSEDEFVSSLLTLGRFYASARSELDLVNPLLERAGTIFGGARIMVSLRTPSDRVVRSYTASEFGPLDTPISIARSIVPSGCTDLEGWITNEEASETRTDFVGVHSGALAAVLSVDGPLDQKSYLRGCRIAEQLAYALIDLGERSETARLRLYAGSIVDRTSVPIAIIDERGATRLTNATLRAAVGNAPLLERIRPEDRREVLTAHGRALRGRSSTKVELSIRVDDMTEKKMLVDFEPIRLPNGEVESVLAVGHDVTRVRQLEDQVTHADRLATLGQLAAGVVHELNNPLTTILVYIEYLLRKLDVPETSDPGDVEKLRRILGAAKRIQEFVSNLVRYSRAERGELESLDIRTVVDDAIDFCEPLISKRGALVTRAYEDIPLVPAVRVQLQQIIINLLTNALQAAPESKGRILVSVSPHGANAVELRFDDNGDGVPEEKREEIFRPFVTTKPTGEGTGLGLSIVRNLVLRHGGTITAGSSSLGGAGFRITLPIRPPSEPPPPGA